MDQAHAYIQTRIAELEHNHGRGMYLIELRDGALPIGICGLLKRESLPDVDLGFALLEDHGGKGFALEAASAVVGYARESLGLLRLLAIVSPANHRSANLLEKLGFVSEGLVRLGPDDGELLLFSASA